MTTTNDPLDKRNILQRIQAVQTKVDYIQKEKKQGMKYSIISHDVVTAKVRPHMVAEGVVYYPMHLSMEQVGNRTQMSMIVRFASVDDPTDYIDCATAGYGIDEQDKGPGKAISYAVKYALLKTLGLESGDDPDEDQDVEHKDPANPHNLAIAAFEADIDMAQTEDQLEKAAAMHRVATEAALAVYPARVQQARTYYKRRLLAIREKEKEAAKA